MSSRGALSPVGDVVGGNASTSSSGTAPPPPQPSQSGLGIPATGNEGDDVPLGFNELASMIEVDLARDADVAEATTNASADFASPADGLAPAESQSEPDIGDLLERFAETHAYEGGAADQPPNAGDQKRRASLGGLRPVTPTGGPSPTSATSAGIHGSGSLSASSPLPPAYPVDPEAAKLITELRRLYLAFVIKETPGAGTELLVPSSSLTAAPSVSTSSSSLLPTPPVRHSRTGSLSARPEEAKLAKAATTPADLGSGASSKPLSRQGTPVGGRAFVPRMTLPPVTIEPFGQPVPLLRFVRYLQRVRQMYPPELFVSDWWSSVLYPILMSSRWKELMDVAVAVCHEMVVADYVDPNFPRAVLDVYIAEADRAMNLLGQQDSEGRWDPVGWSVGAMNLENVVRDVAFAKPREFFSALNIFFVDTSTRVRATRLLSKVLKRDDVAVHYIVDTPLLDSILSSLTVDTYPALVTMELSILVFLMPRIPTQLPALLPRLFRVLTRILLWEAALDKQLDERASGPETTREVKAGTVYTKESVRRCTDMYFTHLYGMWPCSLMDFLRDFMAGDGKDVSAASSSNSWGAGRFGDLLRSVLGDRNDESKTKPVDKLETFADLVGDFEEVEWSLRKAVLEKSLADYFRRYTLHPALFQMTAAAELVQNPERWSQMSDPSEIVAECLERRHRTSAMLENDTAEYKDWLESTDKLLVPGEGSGLIEPMAVPRAKPAHVAVSVTVSGTSESDGAPAAPLAPPTGLASPLPASPAVNLEDVLGQYEVLRGIADEKKAVPTAEAGGAEFDTTIPRSVILQLLLLLNELNLELYFRQIHLSWIRRLRKMGRNEEVINAERDSLLARLQASAQEIKAMERKIVQERELAKQEREEYNGAMAELNKTIAELRESLVEHGIKEKAMLETTQQALDNADALRGRLEDANARIFELETKLSVLEPRSLQLKERDLQITQLTKQLIMWEYDTKAGRAAAQRVRQLEAELANMELLVLEKNKELAETERALSETRTLAASQANKLQSAEKRLDKSETILKEQNASLAKMRMVENEKLKVLEEKYQTIRGINQQLQNRISALMAQLEQNKGMPMHSPISKSQSELMPRPSRAPSPLSSLSTGSGAGKTVATSKTTPSPSAPVSPGQAIRASTQLPVVPEDRKPSRTPSSNSGGQTSQLSAGLARYGME